MCHLCDELACAPALATQMSHTLRSVPLPLRSARYMNPVLAGFLEPRFWLVFFNSHSVLASQGRSVGNEKSANFLAK